MLSTLLRDAFRASDLRSNDLKMIEGILVKAFEREKGTIGFGRPALCTASDSTTRSRCNILTGTATQHLDSNQMSMILRRES